MFASYVKKCSGKYSDMLFKPTLFFSFVFSVASWRELICAIMNFAISPEIVIITILFFLSPELF